MAGRDYRDLTVWQKSMDLAEAVYAETTTFPNHEMFGLCGQLRRAAVSVPSNIAEGQGRRSRRECRKFLTISHGSLCEIETQLLLAQRLRYLTPDCASRLIDKCGEVGRLINGLMRSLKIDD